MDALLYALSSLTRIASRGLQNVQFAGTHYLPFRKSVTMGICRMGMGVPRLVNSKQGIYALTLLQFVLLYAGIK